MHMEPRSSDRLQQWLPAIAFALFLLPSIRAVFQPVFHEDVVWVFDTPRGLHFWMSQGRLVWWALIDPFAGHVSQNVISRALGVLYLLCLGGFCWLLLEFLKWLCGSRLRALAPWALAITHFHFVPLRLWYGFFTITAAGLMTGATLLSLRLLSSRARWKCFAVATLMAVTTFVSLNMHQVGTAFWLALPGLWLVSVCLGLRSWKEEWSKFAWMTAGFAIGGALYGGELVVLQNMAEMTDRLHPTPLNYLLLFLNGVPRWFSAPLPFHMALYGQKCIAISAVLLAIALALPSHVAWWRRPVAVLIALIASIGCVGPVILSEGWFGSRILVGPVFLLNATFAMLLLEIRHRRIRAIAGAALTLAIVLRAIIHVWAFGLQFDVGRLDLQRIEEMRNELQGAGVAPGDRVTIYHMPWRISEIHYGDQGRSTFALDWSPYFMLRPGFFAGTTLPKDIKTDSQPLRALTGRIPSPEDGRFVFPMEKGHWGVDASVVTFDMMRLRTKYLRWIGSDRDIPMRDILHIGIADDALSETAFRERMNPQVVVRPDGATEPVRLWLHGVRLNAPANLRLRLRLIETHPGDRAAIRIGAAYPDGKEKVLSALDLTHKESGGTLEANLPERSQGIPYFEIETHCESEKSHPAVYIRRGELKLGIRD